MAAIKEADKAADYLINSLEFKQEENRLQEKEYEEELAKKQIRIEYSVDL